jgi:TP901 family phage tail tape measure protein
MAGPLGRLIAVLGIDSREFDTGLGRAQKSITGFGKGADLAMGLAAGAVTGALIGTLDAAREWETAFAGVKKTVDTAGMSAEQEAKAFGELEEGLRGLAKVIPITATELAGLAEAGGALGIARDDLVEFARVTAIIGTTTDVVAQDAATALGQIGTVIGLTAEDYDNFGAALVDLGNKGASFESMILEVANRISGTSKLIGFSTQEILGWSSAMANVGIQPEAAGGSFQQFAKTIQQATILGTNKLDAIAETAGMTREAFQELWGESSSQALTAFLSGLSELSEKDQMLTKGLLGLKGIRVSDLISKLTGNIGNLTGSLGISDTAWEENTAMMAEAERRFETLDSGMQLFWNRVNDVAITLGRSFMPILRGVVEHGGNLVDMLGEALKAFPQVTNVVTPLITALTGLMAIKFGGRFLAAMIPGGDQFATALSNSIGGPIGRVANKLGLTFGRAFGLAAAAAAILVFAPEMMKVWDQVRGQIEGIAKQTEAIRIGTFSKAEMEKQLAEVEAAQQRIRHATQLFGEKEGEGIVLFPEATGLTQLEETEAEIRRQLALIASGVRAAAADPTTRSAWEDILNGPKELMATGMADRIKALLGGTTTDVSDWAEGLGGVATEVTGSFDDIEDAIRQGFGSVKAALAAGDKIIAPETRIRNMRNRLAAATERLQKAKKVGDPFAIAAWTAAVAKQRLNLNSYQQLVHTTRRKIGDDQDGMRDHNRRIFGDMSRDTKEQARAAADAAIAQAERTARLVARAFQGLAPRAGAWGADVTRAFAAGLARKNAIAAIESGATNVMASIQDFMRVGSPTKKGPGSKGGGPEGWGQKWTELFAAGLSQHKLGDSLGTAMRPHSAPAMMPAAAAVGGGRGDVHLHIGTLIADDHGLRELDRKMRRATRLASRER